MGIETAIALASTAASGIGALTSSNDMSDMSSQLYGQTKFNPYNVYGPAGSAIFDAKNGGVTGYLSPEFQGALGQAAAGRQQLGNTANAFSTSDYANQYYQNLKSLAAPEQAWSGNDFMDKVYSKGNWGSTTGAHDLWSYANLQNQQDTGMRQQALQSAGQEQTRLFDTYLNALKGEMAIADIPQNIINQGANIGAQASGANNQAAQYPWLAAQNQADASSAFWGNLSGGIGNAATALAKKYGSTGTPAWTGGNTGWGGMTGGDILSGWNPTGSGGGW
jgi:hypothetical protein